MEKNRAKDKRPGVESLLSHSLALDSKARTLLSLCVSSYVEIGTIPTFIGPW